MSHETKDELIAQVKIENAVLQEHLATILAQVRKLKRWLPVDSPDR